MSLTPRLHKRALLKDEEERCLCCLHNGLNIGELSGESVPLLQQFCLLLINKGSACCSASFLKLHQCGVPAAVLNRRSNRVEETRILLPIKRALEEGDEFVVEDANLLGHITGLPSAHEIAAVRLLIKIMNNETLTKIIG